MRPVSAARWVARHGYEDALGACRVPVGTAWIFDRESQLISLRARSTTERHEDGGDRDDVPFRPTRLMERVSRTVEAQPGLSGKGVIAATEGKSTFLRLAIEPLTTEGFIEARGTARNAALLAASVSRGGRSASGSRGSESGSPAVSGTGLDPVPWFPSLRGEKGPGATTRTETATRFPTTSRPAPSGC